MSDWSGRIVEIVDGLEPKLRDVSLDLFEHPEVKFEEVHASKRLASELEAAGFEVKLGVAGLDTAIRAVHPAQSDGPTVAILGEYDALPGLGHACGHNLIAAAGLGAALAVGAVKAELPGRLIFLGTPAEEGGGGKVFMIDEGLFADVDAAMMFHPSSYTILRRGSLAIIEVVIEFAGRSAHASADPEYGINALDAVIQTFNGINALRQHIKDGARIHGIITDGGIKPNIVPDHAAAEFYVRAAENAYCEELFAKLEACAQGAALATGATLTFERSGHAYKAMKPNWALGDAFTRHMESYGMRLNPPQSNAMGSTDMGDVSQVVPSIHAYLEICDHGVAGHSPAFAQASISDRGHRAMVVAAKSLAATAVDVLSDPELVKRMWQEFHET